MRRSIFLLVSIFFIIWGPCLCAWAETAPQKIAVVDMQKVLRQSDPGQKAMESLNEKAEGLRKKLEARENEVKAFGEDMEKKAPLLSEDARIEKDREYKKMLRDFKAEREDAEYEMRQAQNQATESILKELEKIFARIGKETNYTIILDNNMPGLHYVASGIDITDEVIKAYNEASAKGKE